MWYTTPGVGLLQFVRLPSYEQSSKGLLTDADERVMEALLADNPTVGAVVAATGGVRKVRLPLQGRGKRGGARVIYFYRAAVGRIYLILVYPKNEKDNLNAAEKQEMRRLTRILGAEP